MTQITNTQIAAINAATNGALYDADCGWFAGEPVHTAETLAEFETAVDGYQECTVPTRGTIAGFPYVAYRTVQPRRHDTRHSLSVIDLGDVRIAIRENLADYL